MHVRLQAVAAVAASIGGALALAIGCTASPGAPEAVYLAGSDGPPPPPDAPPDGGSGSGSGGTVTINPSSLDLVGSAGQVQTMPINVTGTGSAMVLTGWEWRNDATSTFTVKPPSAGCVSSADPIGCNLAPPITLQPGPVAGMVSCIPSATPRSATLKALANTGASDSIVVTCRTPTANPSFTIPNDVVLSAAVGGMATGFLRVTNDGDESLDISAQIDAGDLDSTQWTAGPLCVSAPCTIAAGDHADIPVLFQPTRDGLIDPQISVASAMPPVGPKTATLAGTGIGGKLRVDQPLPDIMNKFAHDFGTIGKGQTVAFRVEMTNVGNDPITVTPSTPPAPFGVVIDTPPPPIAISADNGMAGFDVTCSSATPLMPQATTVMLGLSPNTYDHNTDHVDFTCAVANTTVQVTNPLDFGEKRVGDDEGVIDVVITNPPGGGDVMITRVELVSEPPPLSLEDVMPTTLADGQTLTTRLHLTTAQELLSLDNASLEIDVLEGSMVTLKLPVTGKVGIASAVVTPTSLDLGSVCVGTAAQGDVTMTNNGSAKLLVQRPTMDSTTFVPLYIKPTDYPTNGAPLLPMDKAMTGVMPASDAKGMLVGNLEWPVDIAAGKFVVPVTLHVLDMGTAVTPARQTFGSYDIDDVVPMPQTVRIENCGPDDAVVSYDHVIASQGKASAWVLDPPNQQRTLLKGEEMRVRVAFVPRTPGAHFALLPISVDGGETDVVLEGDATGSLPDKTSFYACSDCNSPGTPSRGWPLVAAVVLVLRRRRRPC